jgi:hypothetical protein
MVKFWSVLMVLVLSCMVSVQIAQGKDKKGGKHAPKSAEEVFKAMDTDPADGTVTEKEFVAYTLQHSKKSDESKAKTAFAKLGGSDKGLKLEQFKTAYEEMQKKAAERKEKKGK